MRSAHTLSTLLAAVVLLGVLLACKQEEQQPRPAIASSVVAATTTTVAPVVSSTPAVASSTATASASASAAPPSITEADAKKEFMHTCMTICEGMGGCHEQDYMRAPCDCAFKKLRPKLSLEKLKNADLTTYGEDRVGCLK